MWSTRLIRRAQSLTREPVVDQVRLDERVGETQHHVKDVDAQGYTQEGNITDGQRGIYEARTSFALL